jgi:large subunit ribosomal protein L16
MLFPKKVKHRKWHKGRGRDKGVATRAKSLAFGEYGMKSVEEGWVTSRQLEAARRVLVRYIRKGGRIWIRVFPDKPVTKKGNEVPMGGGKGAPDHYIAVVKPGTLLFEMGGLSRENAADAIHMAGYKLGVETKFIEEI